MAIPHWIAFDPDTEDLRRDFEAAYRAAPVARFPEAGEGAAREVEAILRRTRPNAIVAVEPGPHWSVIDR